MLRVAFLTLYPFETASTRQRIYKNVRLLGPDIVATVLPGITAGTLRRGRALGGGRLARVAMFVEEVARKLVHLWRARKADVIVLQKGLTVMNLRGLPSLLFRLGPPVVFDFDDAVYMDAPQGFRARLLRPWFDRQQVIAMLPRFAAVIAGNRFLAAVAGKHNPNVAVIGTPMDTDWYRTRPLSTTGPWRIGWSGSTSTNHYVARLGPVLRQVHRQIPNIELRVISNDDRGIDWSAFGDVPTRFVPWSLESLVEDLLAFDVGLMPLVDDEWSRSKCGGKILQYMACGIVPVASPVGINCEVIRHGENGFLASIDDEWVHSIVALLSDPGLRATMGAAARDTIELEHSNHVTAPQLAAVIRSVRGR